MNGLEPTSDLPAIGDVVGTESFSQDTLLGEDLEPGDERDEQKSNRDGKRGGHHATNRNEEEQHRDVHRIPAQPEHALDDQSPSSVQIQRIN